jgi:hypothetical protein
MMPLQLLVVTQLPLLFVEVLTLRLLLIATDSRLVDSLRPDMLAGRLGTSGTLAQHDIDQAAVGAVQFE